MTGLISRGKLTAYQRWELAAFDEAEAEMAGGVEPPSPPSPEPAVSDGRSPHSDESPVVLPTAADVERIHNEAHAQGYAAGFAEGAGEARAIGDRMNALMASLQEAVGALDQQIAERLLATSVEIAAQMVRQSLRVKPELLLPVIREALGALHPISGHPALFAHPADAALIRSQLGEQLAHNNWRVIEDSSLTAGGCRVEMGASEVDATVETRWRRIIESIGISRDWLSDKP